MVWFSIERLGLYASENLMGERKMKRKTVSIMMLTLILVNAFGMAFIIRPSSAQNGENGVPAEYLVGEKNNATFPDTGTEPGTEDFNASSYSGATTWNFNDTNEWSSFAYMEGNKTRLIVGISSEKPNSLTELERITTKRQAKIVNTISMAGEVRAVVVELFLASVTAFVEEVHALGLASYIEPNMKVQVQFTPNDPYWGVQWGPKKIEADWAWNTTVGTHDVLVAVVDTGIDYHHPDLAANYVPLGYDWANRDSDPLDDFGHGTHCAGIIAAVLNNNIGIAGVAQARIMAEKVLDSGGYGYWDWVASGIINATDCGANIISMSLGGYGASELLHDAVKYAYNHGVLVIAAAGNDNTNMKSYPAGYDEVVAVAATDQDDNKAWFSNWGDWIELAAPGVDIYSTMPTYYVTLNAYGYAMNYDYLSGTSMACPHVSGVAALIWSRYPNKARDWVRLWLRYTADDLGAPGLDDYYGYGRVNARKVVEESGPPHELMAYDLITPPYVEPGASANINATILNFGESDETNVAVQLLANDTVVTSTGIDFLAGGNSTTVTLHWNPAAEGLYNLTLYVVPVIDEASLENNVISKYVYVGFPVKAVVLHSAGNIHSGSIMNWQTLSTEWYLFGDKMVYIDYTTLNRENIAYEDLVASNADVLIISCAYDPYAGWQFTDSEIEAIKQYVHEGHGLIVTAGTFYSQVPNNNKLGSLLGMSEATVWTTTGTDLLHLLNATHPLFAKVPNPLVFPAVGTALPSDGRFDSNELVGGKYLALGHFQESAIVAYRGLMYISAWLEVIPPYYHHHLQLLYNAIMWSRYVKPQHELVASLEVPRAIKPGKSALLNVTVSNKGLSDENNVELQLLINGVVIDSTTIPELSVEDSYTLSHVWTPSTEGIYNITAYAIPVPGEEDITNNVKSVKIFVSTLSVALFQNWDPWEYASNQEALDQYGVPYVVFSSNDIGRVDLSAFAKVVIASDQDQSFYNNMDAYRSWFENYVSNGGVLEIHAADLAWHGGMWIGPLPGGLTRVSYYGQYVTVVDPMHPLLNTPNVITAAELDNWNAAVHGYFSTYPASAHIIIIEDSTGMPVYLEFEYGAGTIIASCQTLEWAYRNHLSLILENSLLYTPAKHEHDIAVAVETPVFLGLGDSVLLNATVINKGLNNETNVELYLIVNGTAVYDVTIDELQVGKSRTVNYLWTPAEIGHYNTTVYALPVPGEEYIQNNVATKMVNVFFYARYYLPHEWVGSGIPMGWHADDVSWQYSLPFDFPFYGINFRTIYISSNGLITFAGPDASLNNGLSTLGAKMAIAPAWDDWVTYEPYDIYVWQNSTHVGIRWYVRAFGSATVANFEVILNSEGVIQFNYQYSNGLVSSTVGISNGAGHMLAEDLSDLNYINTIVFLPSPIKHDVAVISVEPSVQEAKVGETVDIGVVAENQGDVAEDFTVTTYAVRQETSQITLHANVVGSARIYLDPSQNIFDAHRVSVGYRFNVTARVAYVENLAIWQVGMYYNGDMINVTRWFEPTWDPEYVFYGETTAAPAEHRGRGVIWVGSTLMPGPPEQEPFNGSGKLCILEFEITAVPPEGVTYSCALNIDNDDTFLLDWRAIDIPSTKEDGYYELSSVLLPGEYVIGTLTVTGLAPGERLTLTFAWNTTGVLPGDYLIYAQASNVPYETDREDNICYDGVITIKSTTVIIHDVAVIDVAGVSNIAYQGWILEINVTVENLGNGTETFTVTLYYNDTLIEAQNVQDLEPNVTLTLSFAWNTIDIPCRCNYTIKAVASIIPDEIDTENNIFTDGMIELRITGDVNGDGVVNMRDIGEACKAFGSHLGHANWNSLADLNRDGRVDLRDIGTVCCNYGRGM